MKDKLFQVLMFNAPVPDTRALKPQIYRPHIPKEGITAALITLGVTGATASCMAEEVGVFLADRHLVRKSVCKHTCTVCHQHELKDGTKVLGFEPVRKMVSLTVAPWSEWKRASSKAGDRKGRGLQYVMDMCTRCWQARLPGQLAANERRKIKRARSRD